MYKILINSKEIYKSNDPMVKCLKGRVRGEKGGFPSGKGAKNGKFPCDFFAESIFGALFAVAAVVVKFSIIRKGRVDGIFRCVKKLTKGIDFFLKIYFEFYCI